MAAEKSVTGALLGYFCMCSGLHWEFLRLHTFLPSPSHFFSLQCQANQMGPGQDWRRSGAGKPVKPGRSGKWERHRERDRGRDRETISHLQQTTVAISREEKRRAVTLPASAQLSRFCCHFQNFEKIARLVWHDYKIFSP